MDRAVSKGGYYMPASSIYEVMMDEIIRRIKIYEGYRGEPYLCPAGKWTIGYGYNFQDRGFHMEALVNILQNGFTENLAEELLIADVRDCMKGIKSVFPFYQEMSEPRQAVVTDMVYQMGLSGFGQFRKMIAALSDSDYTRAAKEMEDSLWYRQSGRRSRINTKQMQTGVWQEIK